MLLLLLQVFSWPAPGEVPPLHELVVVHCPVGPEVVLVADEALVQRQVGPDRVLHCSGTSV